ncbi:MAG: hypothetical protein IPL33_06590 [Sphingobacteriales bacterium]|nr:hypothetical protein [Sphingobacteriales bacterium]
MVVSNLFYYVKELNPNDWLFYLSLVAQTADKVSLEWRINRKLPHLFCWFILQRCIMS